MIQTLAPGTSNFDGVKVTDQALKYVRFCVFQESISRIHCIYNTIQYNVCISTAVGFDFQSVYTCIYRPGILLYIYVYTKGLIYGSENTRYRAN